jgi:tRNA-dihydrouridine synthase B
LIMNTIKLLNNERNIYEVTPKDKIEMLVRHVKMLKEELNEKIAVLEMRKHAGWYIKGMKNSSEIRNKINKITRADELFEVLKMYLENYNV